MVAVLSGRSSNVYKHIKIYSCAYAAWNLVEFREGAHPSLLLNLKVKRATGKVQLRFSRIPQERI